jgi:hypothetical protein
VVHFNHSAGKHFSTFCPEKISFTINLYGTFLWNLKSARNFGRARVFPLVCMLRRKVASEDLKFTADETGESS